MTDDRDAREPTDSASLAHDGKRAGSAFDGLELAALRDMARTALTAMQIKLGLAPTVREQTSLEGSEGETDHDARRDR